VVEEFYFSGSSSHKAFITATLQVDTAAADAPCLPVKQQFI